jgi:hypothetical protein
MLFITFNILAPTNDISSIITSYNCSYWHISLFNEFVDKFGKLDKVCWTNMFNVKCIVKPSIMKVDLFVDGINNALIMEGFEHVTTIQMHIKLIFNSYMEFTKLENQNRHLSFQSDLVEHLWVLKGSNFA